MSNFLAIATVTATLSDALQAAILADVSGASVTTLRPDASDAMPAVGVNVFLYQVTPNPQWRNEDLPTRRASSELVQRPRAALDLHYLLSFYGADGQLEPQRVLGSVVRTLHARPILTRDAVRTTIGKTAYSYLVKSNLADDIEVVRFTPLPLTLEDLSKLWSINFQAPYRLSVAYQATVVLIESEDSTQAALPVRSRNLYVVPFRDVVVEEVLSAADPESFILAESNVVIRGRHLRADITEVHAGGSLATIQKLGDSEITATLPAGLPAGVQGLQVVQPRMMGTPPAAHRGVESNLAPFVLHPRIISATPTASDVTVKLAPNVGKRQRATLLLNELNAPSTRAARAFNFPAPPRKATDPSDTDTLKFPIAGVPSGDYLARVEIDGADSALQVDPDPDNPRYVGPKVTIP
jgi:Pvc16 N-terminal domain